MSLGKSVFKTPQMAEQMECDLYKKKTEFFPCSPKKLDKLNSVKPRINLFRQL